MKKKFFKLAYNKKTLLIIILMLFSSFCLLGSVVFLLNQEKSYMASIVIQEDQKEVDGVIYSQTPNLVVKFENQEERFLDRFIGRDFELIIVVNGQEIRRENVYLKTYQTNIEDALQKDEVNLVVFMAKHQGQMISDEQYKFFYDDNRPQITESKDYHNPDGSSNVEYYTNQEAVEITLNFSEPAQIEFEDQDIKVVTTDEFTSLATITFTKPAEADSKERSLEIPYKLEDLTGNQTRANLVINFDYTAPAVEMISATQLANFMVKDYQLMISSDEETLAVSANGQPMQYDGTNKRYVLNNLNLQEGDNKVTIVAVDQAGNKTEISASINVMGGTWTKIL